VEIIKIHNYYAHAHKFLIHTLNCVFSALFHMHIVDSKMESILNAYFFRIISREFVKFFIADLAGKNIKESNNMRTKKVSLLVAQPKNKK